MGILLVEDERKLAAAMRHALTTEGYEVTVTNTAEEAFYLLHSQGFDLVLLDLMLPARSGIEMLRDLRKAGLKIPVLIVTSKDSIEDRVAGLDTGANDYLVKPFASPELLARIRALLRWNKVDAPPCAHFRVSDLELDAAGRIAKRGDHLLNLTEREFNLLEYLLINEGRVVSRDMLARDIWKETSRHTPIDNVIDVQVARLRRKMDDPFRKKLLHTVRGIGFVLRDEKD